MCGGLAAIRVRVSFGPRGTSKSTTAKVRDASVFLPMVDTPERAYPNLLPLLIRVGELRERLVSKGNVGETRSSGRARLHSRGATGNGDAVVLIIVREEAEVSVFVGWFHYFTRQKVERERASRS